MGLSCAFSSIVPERAGVKVIVARGLLRRAGPGPAARLRADFRVQAGRGDAVRVSRQRVEKMEVGEEGGNLDEFEVGNPQWIVVLLVWPATASQSFRQNNDDGSRHIGHPLTVDLERFFPNGAARGTHTMEFKVRDVVPNKGLDGFIKDKNGFVNKGKMAPKHRRPAFVTHDQIRCTMATWIKIGKLFHTCARIPMQIHVTQSAEETPVVSIQRYPLHQSPHLANQDERAPCQVFEVLRKTADEVAFHDRYTAPPQEPEDSKINHLFNYTIMCNVPGNTNVFPIYGLGAACEIVEETLMAMIAADAPPPGRRQGNEGSRTRKRGRDNPQGVSPEFRRVKRFTYPVNSTIMTTGRGSGTTEKAGLVRRNLEWMLYQHACAVLGVVVRAWVQFHVVYTMYEPETQDEPVEETTAQKVTKYLSIPVARLKKLAKPPACLQIRPGLQHARISASVGCQIQTFLGFVSLNVIAPTNSDWFKREIILKRSAWESVTTIMCGGSGLLSNPDGADGIALCDMPEESVRALFSEMGDLRSWVEGEKLIPFVLLVIWRALPDIRDAYNDVVKATYRQEYDGELGLRYEKKVQEDPSFFKRSRDKRDSEWKEGDAPLKAKHAW